MGGSRNTTSTAYQSAWSNCGDWCVREETNPMSPPIAKVLDFLSSLVSAEKSVQNDKRPSLYALVNFRTLKKRPPDSSFSTEPTTRKKPRLDSRTVTLTVEPQADPSNREIFDYELDERQADSSSSNRFVFKKRYYESKFGQPLTDEVLSHIIQEYAKGLGWILSYYFQGVPSWNWFYPYDYAPFAINLTEVSAFATHFDSGTQPVIPQLMSLLPPWSSTLVPLSWGNLMSDSNSTIAKFYPSVCKGSALPFLDEDLMKDAVKAVYDQLTDEEKERNPVGSDKLLVGQYHKGCTFLRRLLDGDQTLALQPKHFSGIYAIWRSICFKEVCST
ncbi:5'-3' exoribonuclease 2-like [Daphnia pulicaria]|uniref:5'-3' exoribonuclease 2-like n=1 Tax=Daphnia pulicaria TaxID=35523 RepID=UPI001EEA9D4C|nr:5'-3' exoribonuclease 2-like [Daphnia pulicaria]